MKKEKKRYIGSAGWVEGIREDWEGEGVIMVPA